MLKNSSSIINFRWSSAGWAAVNAGYMTAFKSSPSHRCTILHLQNEQYVVSVTHIIIIYQVCHGVGHCVKNGSCSSSLKWNPVNTIPGINYYVNKLLLLSSTLRMTSMSFSKTAHWCMVCATATAWNSQLHFQWAMAQQPRAETHYIHGDDIEADGWGWGQSDVMGRGWGEKVVPMQLSRPNSPEQKPITRFRSHAVA